MLESRIVREKLKNNFLENYFNNSSYEIFPMPADASFRTYDRIIHENYSYILMNSPPEHYSVFPFIKVAEFLIGSGFSAPKIFQSDIDNGFLLLEDFGNINIGNFLSSNLDMKVKDELYKTIIDLLLKLQSLFSSPELPLYSNEIMLKELELYIDWYIPYIKGFTLPEEIKKEYLTIWGETLKTIPNLGSNIVLYDYHVENMMMLESRKGINKIGLLDFQDAMIGHPLFDVVSVLEDARFEVPKEFAYNYLDYYISKHPGLNKEQAYLSYHILGAQRNSRIIGVFARKARRDNQQNYLNYIPRVLNYLENDLSHESLKPLKIFINKINNS